MMIEIHYVITRPVVLLLCRWVSPFDSAQSHSSTLATYLYNSPNPSLTPLLHVDKHFIRLTRTIPRRATL
jgi:hypothetical protein